MLSQMRRVRQLGSGDVGLVDLVELNDGKQLCAPRGRCAADVLHPCACVRLRASARASHALRCTPSLRAARGACGCGACRAWRGLRAPAA